MNRCLLTSFVIAALLAACTDSRSGPAEARLLVSAAVSLSGPLESVVAEFEKANGTRVELNFAGSDTLATQLIAGAEADLFLSADERQMTRVKASGLLEAGTRADLFSNQLAVVVPADRPAAVSGVNDLSTPRVRRLALGDPDAVPAGVYAKRYLQSVGLWEAVSSKVVSLRNVRAVLAAVEAGNVDAGFVYRTDLALADAATMAFAVPIASGPAIRYPGAVLTTSRQRPLARRLLADLQGPVAQQAFEAAGFIVVTGAKRHER